MVKRQVWSNLQIPYIKIHWSPNAEFCTHSKNAYVEFLTIVLEGGKKNRFDHFLLFISIIFNYKPLFLFLFLDISSKIQDQPAFYSQKSCKKSRTVSQNDVENIQRTNKRKINCSRCSFYIQWGIHSKKRTQNRAGHK